MTRLLSSSMTSGAWAISAIASGVRCFKKIFNHFLLHSFILCMAKPIVEVSRLRQTWSQNSDTFHNHIFVLRNCLPRASDLFAHADKNILHRALGFVVMLSRQISVIYVSKSQTMGSDFQTSFLASHWIFFHRILFHRKSKSTQGKF